MFSQNPYKHIHGNRSFDQTDGYGSGSMKINQNERKIPKASCGVWRKFHVIYDFALVTVFVNMVCFAVKELWLIASKETPLYVTGHWFLSLS